MRFSEEFEEESEEEVPFELVESLLNCGMGGKPEAVCDAADTAGAGAGCVGAAASIGVVCTCTNVERGTDSICWEWI